MPTQAQPTPRRTDVRGSFRSVMVTRLRWQNRFALLWVLTAIGTVITGPGSIEGAPYTRFGFGGIFVGRPETTTQILAFSWLFHRWQRQGTSAGRPGDTARNDSPGRSS